MRWVMLIVSLVSFIMGGSIVLTNPTLPSEPENVTVTEAVAKLDTWKNYISLSADIDLDSRIYSTDVVRPVYALKSTNEVHSVSIADADERSGLKDFLGTTVRINSRTVSGGVQMQMVENVVGKDKIKSQRQLSPLEGSDGGVWVLTNRRVGSEGSQNLKGASVFEGVLTRFVDFDKNLESYIENYSLKKIRKHLSEEQNFEITDETYLVILGLENTRHNLFYCSVEGSNNVLYAAMTDKLVTQPPNPIVGIMESWDVKEEGSLGAMLNQTPPEKIGVINHGYTADVYNKRSSDSVKGTFLFAVIFLFFAVIGFVRKMRKKASN